jgi:hypothetical protein
VLVWRDVLEGGNCLPVREDFQTLSPDFLPIAGETVEEWKMPGVNDWRVTNERLAA